MPRAAAQPIEIVVRATIPDKWATVSWVFVRMQVQHSFEMQVAVENGMAVVKDNTFTMSYPYSSQQRQRFTSPHAPTHHAKAISISNPHYKDMITSVRQLLKDRPMVDEAKTSASGIAVFRYTEFVYPDWYRSRLPSAYDPRELRRVEHTPATTMGVALRAAGLNGVGEDAASSALAIIGQHLPPEITGDTYKNGVQALMAEITTAKTAIEAQRDSTTGKMVPILQGYVALMDDLLARGDKLIAEFDA